MNGKALILIIGALSAGILSSRIFEPPLWVALIPVLNSTLFFALATLTLKKNPFSNVEGLNIITAVSLFGGIGVFSERMTAPSSTSFPEAEYVFKGRIESYTPTNQGDKLLVNLLSLTRENGDAIPVRNIKALVTVTSPSLLSYGDIISGDILFSPYDKPGNTLKRDYENYLRNNHIFLIGTIGGNKLRVEAPEISIPHIFASLRDKLEQYIEKTTLSSETKDFLITILLGDKAYISRADRMLYSDAGVAHIFAVSGFHVSMVAMFIFAILSLVFFNKRRRWKFLVAVPLIWFYVLLTGASPPTIRAAIMLTIGFVALFLQRKFDPAKSLAWAVILILCFDGEALFNIGFQLSVVCVGSILFIAGGLNFVNHRLHPRLFSAVSVVLVALAAAFSSWMVCAFYFHRFSLNFLPMNLLAVPLLPFFMGLSLFYFLIHSIGIPCQFLGEFIDILFRGFHESCEKLNALSSPFTGLHPPLVSVVLWIMGVGALAYLIKSGIWKRKRMSKKILWSLSSFPLLLFLLSITTSIFYPGSQPSGFIIQRNSNIPSVAFYSEGKENILSLPVGRNSVTRLNGKTILTLHDVASTQQLHPHLSQADIIMICKGCKDLSEGFISLLPPTAVVVTHPSLHWRYERRIISKARSRGLNLHSLRYDGPLHSFEN